MNTKQITIILVLGLFTAGFLSCANPKVQQIDQLVRTYFDHGRFNGAVLVAEHGKVIYKECFGFSDFRTKADITSNSQFRVGSVTKQFTAMGIMILKEHGVIDFDDDVKKFLPDLPYEGITIRHMLQHTSGLPDYFPLYRTHWDTANIGTDVRKMPTNQDTYDLLIAYHPPVLFPPGDRHQYCNTGYQLLALIIERITWEPYHEFMRDEIFEPLGMHNTLVYSSIRDDPMPHRVYGYKVTDDGAGFELNDSHFMNGLYGDGGIYTTVEDLFLWDQALYTEVLVSQATLQEAFTAGTINNGERFGYGFGWSIIEDEFGKAVAHGGGWVGFRSNSIRDLDGKNTIILLCNNSNMPKWEIGFKIRDILHDVPVDLPKRSLAITLHQITLRDGVETAIREYHKIKESLGDYDISETQINALGYTLLNMDRVEDAVAIFQLNVEEYPESWNAYDSLGEAYLMLGDTTLAIQNYQKSLDLNPDNNHAKEILSKLEMAL